VPPLSAPPPSSPTPARARFGLAAILMIVARSLRHHALSSSVTIAAVALACGLVTAVFAIQQQTRSAFIGGDIGFDAVLGARGSQLQLVLNSVFHLETSPGNIPWKLYQEVRRDPRVAQAIPYAVGDNYYGFRVVGTTGELFTGAAAEKPSPATSEAATRIPTNDQAEAARRFRLAPGGRYFDETRREAVVGSFAAQRTGLTVGSVFSPYHGLTFNPNDQHAEEYVVVGVLEPTNSPADRVIWIPIEGVFRLGGHVLRGSGQVYTPQSEQAIPDEHKEVSAVMLRLRHPQAGIALDQLINKQGKVATLAFPIGAVMADLFDKIGWMSRVLELVAYLVVLVSAAAILASLYNTINERRREFAILRAIGARRRSVFMAIVLESSAIAALGALLGYVVYAAIVSVAATIVRQQTGVVLDVLAWHPVLAWAPAGMAAAGSLVGLVPAMKAYATDVASNLSPTA
jgi:putative ABC transport system permease protein